MKRAYPGLACPFFRAGRFLGSKSVRRSFAALTHNAKLRLALIAALRLRQRLLINKVAGSQGRISVPRRVAARLLHRAKMEKSRQLEIPVTRDVPASRIRISRESLCRGLSALGAQGLIVPERRRIALLDLAALQQLAGE